MQLIKLTFSIPMKISFFLFLGFLQIHFAYPQKPVDQVDVCVYGGTSGGVIAAYTARKMGKSVLLIEPGKHLGGLSAGGLGQTDIGNKYAITGLARDFYRRIGQQYGKLEQWTFEPHVAENIFNEYIRRAKVPVLFQYRIVSAKKQDGVIREIVLENSGKPTPKTNRIIRAKMFIDCSYEGDLMARAGVSYTVGREANSRYKETYNGVQLLDKHQFPDGVDPYKIPGKPESGLLWGISPEPLQPDGSGDEKVQAYNFRLCLTDSLPNQIPVTRPPRYDSTRYELLLRYIEKRKPTELNWALMHIQPMPGHKTDINNSGGFSTDMIGMNYGYPDGGYETRRKIIGQHEDYTKGLLHFLGNDRRVPQHLRNEMRQWGYPKDEYTDNENFSPQLYIREARRMTGAYVMTQANCEGRETVTDGVGMAAYTMDSHNCQRVVANGMAKNEGDVQAGGFGPYPVSYRALMPKEAECKNLLVPVCLSASHIAYGSIRMEPVFMVLGQSAAVAASLAIDGKSPVQKINVAALQNQLKTNPLADNSPLEILIDDADKNNVQIKGEWKAGKLGRCYGASLLSDDNPAVAKSVTFSISVTQVGDYDAYVYSPEVPGKSSRLTVRLQAGQIVKNFTLSTPKDSSDWLHLGKFGFPAGGHSIEISNQNADGLTIADAVLLVPVWK